MLGGEQRVTDVPIDAPDIMPTLLGLAGLPIPQSVEGLDFSGYLKGGQDPSDGAALIACYHPFHNFCHAEGGREYRGLRTSRYTYVRALKGPWLLYDNERDPHQLDNLVGKPEYAEMLDEFDARLQRRLDALGDEFLPNTELIKRWGYHVDERDSTPF